MVSQGNLVYSCRGMISLISVNIRGNLIGSVVVDEKLFRLLSLYILHREGKFVTD
jgi:hypothetical protein